MRTTKLLFALVVPAVFIASVAVGWQFKNVFVDTGTITKPVPISGSTGAEASVGFDGYFLTEVDWGEKQDNPCSFTVHGMRRSGDAWQVAEPTTLNFGACEKKSVPYKVQVVQPSSDGSSGKFISALQVCKSEKKTSSFEKVKGIRIRTSRVDENGAVTANAGDEEYFLKHCKTWESWVSCPAGQLVRRLILNTDDGSAKGIGIECAPVYTGARPK